MFDIVWNFLFTLKTIGCLKLLLIVWQQQYLKSKKVSLFKLDNLVVKIAYYDTTLSKCTSYRTIIPTKTKGDISYLYIYIKRWYISNIYIYIYICIYIYIYMYIYMYIIYIGLINIVNMDWEDFLKSQIIEEGGFYSSYGGARPYS